MAQDKAMAVQHLRTEGFVPDLQGFLMFFVTGSHSPARTTGAIGLGAWQRAAVSKG
jgi:hypothetical protein